MMWIGEGKENLKTKVLRKDAFHTHSWALHKDIGISFHALWV